MAIDYGVFKAQWQQAIDARVAELGLAGTDRPTIGAGWTSRAHLETMRVYNLYSDLLRSLVPADELANARRAARPDHVTGTPSGSARLARAMDVDTTCNLGGPLLW